MYEPEEGSRRLRCDFPQDETQRPEKQDRSLKLVDFVWQPADATWLVEIKDPMRPDEPYQTLAIRETVAALQNGQLIDEHFLPKIFGTYLWLSRGGSLRPVTHRYAVLITVDPLDSALRIAIGDQIQRGIDAVGPLDRSSGNAPIAEVHDLTSWNASHGYPPIVREP